VVETLANAHLDAVVGLHTRCLTGLLRSLGDRATRAYYRGFIRSDRGIGFVDLHEGEPAGFVVGSTSPLELRREILRRNSIETLVGTSLGFARNPVSAASFLRSAFARGDRGYDGRAPELTYLAVDEKLRGAGIGRRLVEAFDRAVRGAGGKAYELSVDADNLAAIRFYETMGFAGVCEYREFGILHKRYRRELG
jgi:ribosomal protein S18 acetylase RimI-like enzyme